MSVYKPTMRHLREVLLYYFNSKESAYKASQMLIHAYGENIISTSTCERNFRHFRSGDFNLNRPTVKPQDKERVIKELVRLRVEDPSMSQKIMAAKVGKSQTTVSRYESSQEYKNELKKLQQNQSSIPLKRLTSSALKRKRTVEELVRLRLEDPRMTQEEMAAKVGVTTRTVYNYQRSQEYQNELKKLQQDQSSIPSETTTLKRQRRELEEEESLNSLNEIQPTTQDEITNIYGMSISETEEILNNMERQSKLKEKGLEPSCDPLERPSTSRTPRTESEYEEIVNNMYEFPHLSPDE